MPGISAYGNHKTLNEFVFFLLNITTCLGLKYSYQTYDKDKIPLYFSPELFLLFFHGPQIRVLLEKIAFFTH